MTKLRRNIESAVERVVNSPYVDASSAAIAPITQAVTLQAEAEVNRVTGNVPWYKSPTLWGLFALLLTRQLAHWGYEIPQEYHGEALTFIVTYGPYMAGAIIAWGQKSIIKRWFWQEK